MKPWPLLLPALLLGGATGLPATSALQQRLDRILAAADQPAGSLRIEWTLDEELRLEQRGRTLAIPRSLVAAAPSGEALDGVIAMMAAYQRDDGSTNRKPSLGEYAAAAAITAATGGVSENGDASRKRLPIVPGDAAGTSPDPAIARRQSAWRGARWSSAAGSCTDRVTAFLRQLTRNPTTLVGGRSTTISSASAAQRILRDMGSLAYPSSTPCTAPDDTSFERLRMSVRT